MRKDKDSEKLEIRPAASIDALLAKLYAMIIWPPTAIYCNFLQLSYYPIPYNIEEKKVSVDGLKYCFFYSTIYWEYYSNYYSLC